MLQHPGLKFCDLLEEHFAIANQVSEPAPGDLAVLFELVEFFVDFLSVVMSWCRSLPPLVHLAPEYSSVAKWANPRTTNWD